MQAILENVKFPNSYAAGGTKFRFSGNGLSHKEDRHEPPFNVFRG
jgi:hypothetical protein